MPPNNPFKIDKEFGQNGNLSGIYRTNWVEESLDLEHEIGGKFSISHTNSYVGTSIGTKKIWLFLIIIGIIMSIILLRVFQLQVIKGEYYRSLAEGNRIRLLPVPAERGIIYDRYNRDLLKNIPDFSLTLIPQDIPKKGENRTKALNKLADMSGMEVSEIEKVLKKYGAYGYESLTIKNNLDYETALKLYVENASLPGVEIESGSKRGYYFRANTSSQPVLVPSLSHIIGYVGKLSDEELGENRKFGYLPTDLIGKTGLEKTYETILRGTYGKKKIEVNAIGKEQSVLATEPPIPGKNLVLSLDLDAQKTMEQLVKDTAEKSGRRKVSAIAMNPINGEILAMVSWPTFNNNEFASGIDQKTYNSYIEDKDRPLFNRAIGGLYPPGSTVKLIMSAAALQEKIITKHTSVSSVGGIEVGGSYFKDWKAGGHGVTNVTKAIAWSVNTFYYYIGGGFEKFVGLGIDRIGKYFSKFGLSNKTGIDLPGENAGFIPSKEWKKSTKKETWYVGDTYNVSIGQGDLLVTPLQVAVWTAAVANGGNLVQPHLAKKTYDPITKKENVFNFSSTKIEDMSSGNLQIVRDGMKECVTLGSCKMLGGLGFQAGGKTGTAQWSKNHPTHAWFTSFAPLQDPQIVVTVLVEEGGEGSTVAQPIAYRFLDWWGKKYLR